MSDAQTMRIAVIIPCFNEGPAIRDVVKNYQEALPDSDIYVYDNNSTDDTVDEARLAGAIVRSETRQGKGHVIRRAFADIEADIYLLVDGDGTYDAQAASAMVDKLATEKLDMVVGIREEQGAGDIYRKGHRFGNKFLTKTITILFEETFTDVLSGYRVLSRRFVKTFPQLAQGFEIEVMLSIHALELCMPVAEYKARYFERAQGSESKLSTYKDGFKILGSILALYKAISPMAFFGILSGIFSIVSVYFGLPVVFEFMETGLVPRFPTAILASGLMVLSGILLTCGLILDSVSAGRREQKRLHYLTLP